MNSLNINSNDYNIIELIGKGGFGEVYLVENKTTKQLYAAKVDLISETSNLKHNQNITREISILTRFQYQTIIRFFGFSTKDFKDRPFYTIFMEYMENGSLEKLIQLEHSKKAPPEYDNTAKQIILCGIAHGMMTLHSRRVIHRDLKPANILLDSNYKPRITDFGLSKFFDYSKSSRSSFLCGTLPYMAPEIFQSSHYSTKSDVYSFGILMYEVLTGEQAFGRKRDKKVPLQFQAEIVGGARPKFNVPIKKSFQKLCERCWSADPRQRPTFKEPYKNFSLLLENDEDQLHFKSNEEEEEEEEEDEDKLSYYQYCLENVDINRVLDYVDEISGIQPVNTKEQEKKIEEQAKCILELKQKISSLEKQNQSQVEEQNRLINLLKLNNDSIKQSNNQATIIKELKN